MSKQKGGLGRGLAALIPTGPRTTAVTDHLITGSSKPAETKSSDTPSDDATSASPKSSERGERAVEPTSTGNGLPDGVRYEEVPIGAITPNPRNPRTVFDEDALSELEHSIREFGLLQPIVVRENPTHPGEFELVMGERRWRAAERVGLETVPAIVRPVEDAELLRDALLENIHRANLNPLEEAAAYQQLLDEFEVTHEELATRLGRSRPVISNTIRLLKLPVPVQRRVAAGVLSAGHARALLSLEDPGAQEDLAARIVAEGLSVRGTEEQVTLLASAPSKARRKPVRKMTMPAVDQLGRKLSDAFDTRVRVDLGRRKGKVTIEFATLGDLQRIVELMSPSIAGLSKAVPADDDE